MTLLLALCAALAAPVGWRHDGSAAYEQASPPVTWEANAPAWKGDVPAWGNATPVLLKGKLCATAEPTTLFCSDAATGKLLWSATNDYVDTLAGEERTRVATKLSAAEGLKVQMKEVQRRASTLRRELRKGADVASDLEAASRELDLLKRTYDELATYLTPPDLDMIGYASSTPVTDGEHLYVMLGHGVVSKFTPTGERVWSVWLGPPPQPMLGYEFGSVTSPQLTPDGLLVGHGNLQLLDTSTGAVRWKDPALWNHYGTPALMSVGSNTLAITPDGRALRTSDGRELARGLADLWYVGPVAKGDTVWFVGGQGNETSPENTHAAAWRLTPDGSGGVTAAKLWAHTMPKPTRIYSTPLVHDGLLYSLDIKAELVVLDSTSGELVWSRNLSDSLMGTPYQSPTLAGQAIFLATEHGYFATVKPGRSYTLLGTSRVSGMIRASPVFEGKRVYLRGLEAIYSFSN